MGGDRDGNPNVTAEVTKKVILFSRWQAAKLYEKELTKLIQDLSMEECSPKIRRIVGKTFEPYRVYLRPIRDKIRSTYQLIERHLNKNVSLDENKLLQDKNEILEPLRDIRESLNLYKGQHIANSDLLDLIRRIRCFGINLAKLDIRQESSRHEKLINEVIKKKYKTEYIKISESKKINLLNYLIKQKKYFLDKIDIRDKENKEVWNTFKQISKEPAQCLGAYVISMTSKASDILTVYFLQKQAQTRNLLRVAPLFETLDDLKNAKEVMENLFKLSWYRKLINHQQEVMIGYSDSSKDAGKLSASWHQYKLQEELRNLAKKYKINLVFFHGRGGSAGRGGGPIQATLKSQPSNTVNGKIRITDQGEVIQQKYGYKPLAEYNLCSYIGAVMDASLNPPPRSKKNWRDLIEKMSEISTSAYRKNLNHSEDFIRYFKTVTPNKSLGKLAIGSRPTKRKNVDNIQSLRAIPWIFAWTQIRLMLPAWLGSDTALAAAIAAGKQPLLSEMYERWPFFRSYIELLEMLMAKTDAQISAYYEKRLVSTELGVLGSSLRQRLVAMQRLVLEMKQQETLLQYNPIIKESIEVRNPYLDPLHFLQAELLYRDRNHPEEQLEQALMVTIAGISAGMRNTG